MLEEPEVPLDRFQGSRDRQGAVYGRWDHTSGAPDNGEWRFTVVMRGHFRQNRPHWDLNRGF